MSKKNKRLAVILLAALVLVAGIVIALIAIGNYSDTAPEYVPYDVDKITVESTASGLEVKSLDSISAMFVEDGSDDVLEDVFAVDIANNSDTTLQYAELVFTIDGEEYSFSISTIPPKSTVRAMEMNRKVMPTEINSCTMRAEHIAWFPEESSLHPELFEIEQRPNAIILTNISGEAIEAPISVYFKNYVDGVYVGGITYVRTVNQSFAPGETIVVDAGHFDPKTSRLMYINVQ